MKEMKYLTYEELTKGGEHVQHIVLDKGEKDGYKWFILSLGRHPCAYVAVPIGHPLYDKTTSDIEGLLDCHGGITFTSNDFFFNPIVVKNVHWIGWDYAHSEDYTGFASMNMTAWDGGELKRWTTEEIRKEVMNIIKQLKRMKKR
jgi:hypothetical protein